MPKRQCANRAEWRLLRGKPTQQLPAQYRLDCDYGMPVITIFNEGEGDAPIYLCAVHAAGMRRSENKCVAGVRPVEVRAEADNCPATTGDVVQTRGVLAAEPISIASASPKVVKRRAPAKVPRDKRDSPVKIPARDLSFGNLTKALVDETIWNMAPGDYDAYRSALQQGKSVAEAAQAAGGQMAVVHRKISEYTFKIESVLADSKAKINVREVIDAPLERAVLEIIGNTAIADADKDAAVEHLGALQERINRGLDRDTTPLEAHRIGRAIADSANWGATSRLAEHLKPAYRAVYAGIRDAIRGAVPDAQSLDDRLANLHAAKADLESAPALQKLHCLIA